MSGQILGLIPARAGSVEVLRKNVRNLGGQPLLNWTIDAARASRLDRVVLSTDSPEFAAIGRQAGAEVPFLRPAALANSSAKAIGVIHHALAYFREREGWEPSAVLYLQPTSPFRSSVDIDGSLATLSGTALDSVLSFTKTADHPSYVYWREGDDLHAILPHEPQPERRQDMRPAYISNCAIMGSKTSWLLRPGAAEGLIVNMRSFVPYFIEGNITLDINSERDFQLAEVLFEKYVCRS